MKLMFVLGNIAGHGGTERATCGLANALTAAGEDVEILSPFGHGPAYFELSSTVPVTALALPEAQGKLGRFMRISYAIHRHCRRSRPDVVILVDTILFLFCLPWAWWSASRFVCWEHFNLSTEHYSRFRTLARKAAAQWSDAIVVLTERDAQAWQKRFSVDGRVHAIWNPIPRFDEKPSDLSERRKIVLAVGRLTEQKGFDVLLRGWQRIGKERDGWMLRIVGSGADEIMLKRLARDLEITDTVQFAGQTKAIAREYRAASIYVMSSRWEGLPMTLLEAQYFGLPSVATDCETGPREVLAGDSGLLVPVDDFSALADALEQLLAESELRASLARKALSMAKKYNAATVQERWKELFTRLLAGY